MRVGENGRTEMGVHLRAWSDAAESFHRKAEKEKFWWKESNHFLRKTVYVRRFCRERLPKSDVWGSWEAGMSNVDKASVSCKVLWRILKRIRED